MVTATCIVHRSRVNAYIYIQYTCAYGSTVHGRVGVARLRVVTLRYVSVLRSTSMVHARLWSREQHGVQGWRSAQRRSRLVNKTPDPCRASRRLSHACVGGGSCDVRSTSFAHYVDNRANGMSVGFLQALT